ncbi:hypothetical protein Celaphus_00005439, partial [Cervus elaphus hippelaphus]
RTARARLGRGGARSLARRLWVQLGPTCPTAPADQPARVQDRPQPHEGVRKSVPGLTEDVKKGREGGDVSGAFTRLRKRRRPQNVLRRRLVEEKNPKMAGSGGAGEGRT